MANSSPRPLVPGVYVPVISIFKDDADQSVDYETYKSHVLRLAKAGLHGFVVQGSTAESVALSFEEKGLITKATRETLDSNGFTQVPIIVGASGQSTNEVVKLAVQAKESGGDYILTLPPSFFAPNMTFASLEAYYIEIADRSPVPVLIYSYPGIVNGLELPSESVTKLAKHTNIVGIKQTDHNVGKMARITYENPDFCVLAGASDYFLGALSVGARGAITGYANLFPNVVVQFFKTYQESLSSSTSLSETLSQLRTLQGQIAVAEGVILTGGIPSVKYACQHFYGYGGIPRRPVPESPDSVKKAVEQGLKASANLEKSLVGK